MYFKRLLLIVSLVGISACSTSPEHAPATGLSRTSGGCGPDCSQAFILGTHRPVAPRTVTKPECDPGCP
ncbi:MAG: hypothetical protein RLZZ226_1753 [Pseudomonadota bacterium]|jgi:hypothetical protein